MSAAFCCAALACDPWLSALPIPSPHVRAPARPPPSAISKALLPASEAPSRPHGGAPGVVEGGDESRGQGEEDGEAEGDALGSPGCIAIGNPLPVPGSAA